jgi:DNA-binding Lrp family transcriptional regulator
MSEKHKNQPTTHLQPTATGLHYMNGTDPIDAKVLQELLRNGRKSFTTIAKEADIPKDVVWKHFNRMKKTGLITGATIQQNPQNLGYEAVATILLSIESQAMDEVVEKLNIPEVYIFRQYNGRFNVGTISRLKKLRDLDRIKEMISRNKAVNEIKSYIWTDVRNIPENIIASNVSTKTEPFEEKNVETDGILNNRSIEVDDLDMKIIDCLSVDGRVSFRKIALKVGTSTDTVARRYQTLIENNVIKISIQIKPEELGFRAILDTSVVFTTQNETKEIVDRLSKIPGVTYIVKITGDYDLQVVALVKDCQDIMRINDEILKIKHIKRTEAFLRQFREGYSVWPGAGQHITTF